MTAECIDAPSCMLPLAPIITPLFAKLCTVQNFKLAYTFFIRTVL